MLSFFAVRLHIEHVIASSHTSTERSTCITNDIVNILSIVAGSKAFVFLNITGGKEKRPATAKEYMASKNHIFEAVKDFCFNNPKLLLLFTDFIVLMLAKIFMKHNRFSRKHQIYVANWLFICAFMVFLMVVIGGLTRLTESGLSIVEWKPISGVFPPVSESGWNDYFQKYKQSPQYIKINKGMNLHEFKQIFWLEYIHRLAGRITGLIFIIPFAFFLFKGWLEKPIYLIAIFLLGAMQGIIGWYMVKSGLSKDPYVSHYRLTFHLMTAFVIFSLIFWLGLKNMQMEKLKIRKNALSKFSYFVTALIFIQSALGGLVAGKDAGLVYNTFPLMNGYLFPPDLFSISPLIKNFGENITTIQFTHRLVGTILLLAILCFFMYVVKSKIKGKVRIAASMLLIGVLIQYCAGIFTLLYQVPVPLASFHQAMAMILLSFSLFINYNTTYGRGRN